MTSNQFSLHMAARFEPATKIMTAISRWAGRRTVFGALCAFAFLVLLTPITAVGQWASSGNDISNTNSGSVGIGTTSPNKSSVSRALTVNGSSAAIYELAVSEIRKATLYHDGTDLSLTNNANGMLKFGTNNTYRMFIDAGGNVGIGTSSPTTKLHVNGGGSQLGSTTGYYQFFAAQDTTNYRGIFLGYDTSGQIGIVGSAPGSQTSSQLSFWNYRNSAWAESMRIDGSGNVGIGTTSPTQKLSVAGTIESTSGGFKFPDGTLQTTASSGGGGGSGTITGVTAGSGLTGGGTSGSVNLNNNDRGSDQNIFKNIANASGTNQFSAGSNNDVVRFAGTGGASVSFDATTKKVTVDASGITSSQWTTSGSDIKYAPGNVGIGVSGAPTAKLDVNGDIHVSGDINAKYQDVAEWVPASEQLPAGTVVVLDATKSNQVIASTVSYDTKVAGVISEQPGIALGEKSDGKVLVATTGRVRVKVDASKGSINIGDLLVTSDVPGSAMKSEPVNIGGVQIHRPGTLIGKALEPLAKGSGTILVLLSLQ